MELRLTDGMALFPRCACWRVSCHCPTKGLRNAARTTIGDDAGEVRLPVIRRRCVAT